MLTHSGTPPWLRTTAKQSAGKSRQITSLLAWDVCLRTMLDVLDQRATGSRGRNTVCLPTICLGATSATELAPAQVEVAMSDRQPPVQMALRTLASVRAAASIVAMVRSQF